MVRQHPRRAQHTPWKVRVGRLAVPTLIAGLATTGIVAAATGSTVAPQVAAVPATTVTSPAPTAAATPQALIREQRTNRSQSRAALSGQPAKKTPAPKAKKAAAPVDKKAAPAKKKAAPVKKKAAPAKKKVAPAKVAPAPPLTVVGRKYNRVDLNVRAAADADARLLTVLDSGSRLSVTATVRDGWRYVSYRGKGAWVRDRYLVNAKPKPAAKVRAKASAARSGGGGVASSGACAGGSAVERGLTSDAIRLHRTICARFPAVKSYGGLRADANSEHSSGRALDIMVSGAAGWEIARFARANAKQLGVSQVLYAQKIWTVQRSSEGWRSVSDRGSVSANHYDHVHVSVYGSSAG